MENLLLVGMSLNVKNPLVLKEHTLSGDTKSPQNK